MGKFDDVKRSEDENEGGSLIGDPIDQIFARASLGRLIRIMPSQST
jgi:hypothetical protein